MILVVGLHPDYQDNAPDCERWVVGKSKDRDADCVFEMHRPQLWKPRLDHLNDFDCPIYMQEAYPEVRQSVAYPLADIVATFGRFQTSSVNYMIALALYEGEDVALWGVGGDTEAYEFQTPEIAFFAGYARANGQRLIVHPDTALHRILNPCARYGYDGEAHLFTRP